MVAAATALFAVGAAAAAGIVASLLVTLATDVRLWPPEDDRRKAVLHWGLVGVFDVCILGLAVLRWGTWSLPRPASLVGGGVLSAVGAAVFVRASRAMNAAETTGQAATELYTEGLYARTRNPQYLGMLVGLAGFVLLAAARGVAALAALHACWLVLLPFAEEPWLRAQFGEQYERYCERVPRFVGIRTVTGE